MNTVLDNISAGCLQAPPHPHNRPCTTTHAIFSPPPPHPTTDPVLLLMPSSHPPPTTDPVQLLVPSSHLSPVADPQCVRDLGQKRCAVPFDHGGCRRSRLHLSHEMVCGKLEVETQTWADFFSLIVCENTCI